MSVNIYNSNPNATSEEENFSCVADRGSKLASDTIYSNTTSGLTSVNVQGAIDEVNEKVEDNADAISQINSDLSDLLASIPFYDTTNVTPIGNFQNPIKTYTATSDCIACCRIVTNLTLGQIEVKVNNETVYAQFNGGSFDIVNWVSIPLKNGQTITISGSASDNYIVKVIGVGK